ncbi:hypothetical protein DFS34DRAFT_598081 [Phlyctochytrium arcticum]|nr:hypothetical protein DFS34DRAFT_598081 [Phlyctochytrium arcticum]
MVWDPQAPHTPLLILPLVFFTGGSKNLDFFSFNQMPNQNDKVEMDEEDLYPAAYRDIVNHPEEHAHHVILQTSAKTNAVTKKKTDAAAAAAATAPKPAVPESDRRRSLDCYPGVAREVENAGSDEEREELHKLQKQK